MSTINVFTEICGNDYTNIYYLDEFKNQQTPHWRCENELDKHFLFSHYLSFGDYDNSCAVERSNVRVFEEMYADCKGKDWIKITGHYGWECIAVRLSSENTEIIETLKYLENYPCLDDQDVSLMEMEMENESWDNWIKDDLIKELKKLDPNNENIYNEDITDENKLMEYYNELKKRANEYFIVESGGNGYIDVEKLANYANCDELANFLVFEYID